MDDIKSHDKGDYYEDVYELSNQKDFAANPHMEDAQMDIEPPDKTPALETDRKRLWKSPRQHTVLHGSSYGRRI